MAMPYCIYDLDKRIRLPTVRKYSRTQLLTLVPTGALAEVSPGCHFSRQGGRFRSARVGPAESSLSLVPSPYRGDLNYIEGAEVYEVAHKEARSERKRKGALSVSERHGDQVTKALSGN